MNPQVLIVGAGPTGLTLALWLRKQGVAIRIIDKNDGPGETSRALAVQARTLEFHRQLGVVDDVLAEGVKIEALGIRTHRGLVAQVRLGEFGAGLTRYPYAFALPQDVHERILIDHLAREGVTIDRRTELLRFVQDQKGVEAILQHDNATEIVRVDYLCGADGAHSVVRHNLNIGFPGGAYEQKFYVADVEGAGDVTHGGMDVNLGYGFGVVMPVRQNSSIRLIGVVPKACEDNEGIAFDDIRAEVERDTGVTVRALNWFSTYRVHHRVAEKFRVGRVFLLGDAGHVHSPAGGQGMNTGIGDAVNLAWKLSAVLRGEADAKLLDTYEPERIAFAHLLIKSTDQAFRFAVARSPLIRSIRQNLLPHVVDIATRTTMGRRLFFDTISQTRVEYRTSALSDGRVGRIGGGDRLPYVETPEGDNHAPLATCAWQVHVYGRPSKALTWTLMKRKIPLHRFAWSRAVKNAGLKRNAAYLVRPDGYIACVTTRPDRIAEKLSQFGVVLGPSISSARTHPQPELCS